MKLIANDISGEEAEAEIYWCNAICTNCNLVSSLAFWKYFLIIDHLCPNCECKTLQLKAKI